MSNAKANAIVAALDDYLEAREELKSIEKSKNVLLSNIETARERVKWKRSTLTKSLQYALGEKS